MPSEIKESARLEALSDGVFAVAITLLVLEIKVPAALGPDQSLGHELLKLWPQFLAFVLSFMSIGIMWMNHHRIFKLLARTDDGLQVVNGALLLLITFVPFPTAVFAQNLMTSHAPAAAAFYSATFVVCALVFNLLTAYIRRRKLLGPSCETQEFAHGLRKQYFIGPSAYSLLTGIAFVNVYACLALHVLLALYFAVPPSVWVGLHARGRER
ncbi:MAG TPA: TMEM175 family protein [Fimbriimonadaceae bacterium]|nr:TMEM175 family protein [Fimbriimonadaceae bacterium]